VLFSNVSVVSHIVTMVLIVVMVVAQMILVIMIAAVTNRVSVVDGGCVLGIGSVS
jgi:hypothetical protein